MSKKVSLFTKLFGGRKEEASCCSVDIIEVKEESSCCSVKSEEKSKKQSCCSVEIEEVKDSI